jgi:hypothetical protein
MESYNFEKFLIAIINRKPLKEESLSSFKGSLYSDIKR